MLIWADANTKKYETDGPNDKQDRWCDDCECSVNFIDTEKEE